MLSGVFLSIVEFTLGDTRPRESAWVVEAVWRRRPSRRRLAPICSALRVDLHTPGREHPSQAFRGRDDIQAALRYAADSIAHEVIVLRVPGPER